MDKKLKELLKQASEIRLKLLEADPDADGAAETRAADTKALAAAEKAIQTALAEPDPAPDPERRDDGEGKEFRALESRAKLSPYLAAAMEGTAVAGAEAEFNAAMKIGANQFPLRMLAPPEERAATDTDTTVRPLRWLDRLFAETAAMHIGVTFDSVAPGIASYPVTTAGAAAAQRKRAEAAADAAWTIGVSELKPKRNAVRAVFTTEDAARIPGLEDALTRDLRAALTEGVDRAIFIGDDGGADTEADIVGLTTAANVNEQTLTQANKVKAEETLAAFLDLVDGKHASKLTDLKMATSVGANTLWGRTVANSAAENQTIAQFLMKSGMSWMTRGDIDTATGNGKFGAFIGRGRGLPGAGVAAMWAAGTLIRDPYSNAAKGEVAVTLNYLWDFALPRPSNFSRLKFIT